MISVFILGLYDTGLYTAQLLGSYGVTVYGFDHVKNHPGFYSKYISATLIDDPIINNDNLIKVLINKVLDLEHKPILLASSELYLNFMHVNRLILKNYFEFLIPEKEILNKIIHKAGQFQMAESSNVCVPRYFLVSSAEDLDNLIIDGPYYPLIIKGNDQQKWKSANLKKSYIVENEKSLKQLVQFLLTNGVSLIVQSIVDGPVTNNYEYNALMVNGKIIESSVIKKVRQYPVPYGAAICVETCINDKVEELGKRFVLENKIEGFSNTEFKIDPITGVPYFIETNSRVWLQIKVTKSFGQNFMVSFYNLYCPVPKVKSKILNFKKIKWVDPFGDLMYLLRVNRSLKGFFVVIASYCNARSFGLLNFSDFKPFMKSIKNIFSNT